MITRKMEGAIDEESVRLTRIVLVSVEAKAKMIGIELRIYC